MFIEMRMVRAKGARRGRQPWLRTTGRVRSRRVSEMLLDNSSQEINAEIKGTCFPQAPWASESEVEEK